MTDYKETFAREAEAVRTAIKDRAFAPHCDALILHKPSLCWACDGYPDWQQAREAWGINFTGEQDPEKLICPAEIRRPIETINRWHGNVAETAAEADAHWANWLEGLGKRSLWFQGWRRGQR